MADYPIPVRGTLFVRQQGALAWLVIDNPARRNALSLAMWQEVAQRLAPLASDPGVRALIVTGARAEDGSAGDFSAGADISEFETTRATAEAASRYDAANLRAFDALRTFPKPTIALIKGNCLGGGIGLALACDLRLAADTAHFCLPPARLGLAYPPAALKDVVNTIGGPWTKRLIFTGERIDAATALTIGLVDEVQGQDHLDIALKALTDRIVANAPLSHSASKAAVAASLDPSNQASRETAEALANACYDSRDFAEGRQAFLEKRRPVFNGT